MCGIVGGVSTRDVVPILTYGLHKLEYRGYDSAGMAIIKQDNILTCKTAGKVAALEAKLIEEKFIATTAIAHTRWATHGAPSSLNSHPHTIAQRISLVHNGIIENYLALKDKLINPQILVSETDSEIIAALIYEKIIAGQSLLVAVKQIMNEIVGAYAICVIDALFPDNIVVAKNGSPLIIGLGIQENFIASDQLALHKVATEFIFLEDLDAAVLGHNGIEIFDFADNLVEREIITSTLNVTSTDKGQYRHYMQKEIFEQPYAINSTMAGRVTAQGVLEKAFGLNAPLIFDKVQTIEIVACGTSFYAGMVAKYWLEALAGIRCNVEVASEFRYRQRVTSPNTLLVAISQSGETADTIAAIKDAKLDTNYLACLAICNVAQSSIVRLCNLCFLTHAGQEVGVASTKAFTTQLTALFMLTLCLGKRHKLTQTQYLEYCAQLMQLPELIEEFLGLDNIVHAKVKSLSHKSSCIFLGRGSMYPIALEGALKLKEISYINANAYPGGELKHGPLALVDEDMPIIALAPNADILLDKLKTNIAEVISRGGKVMVFAPQSAKIVVQEGLQIILLPEMPSLLAPIAYAIPLQMLAYHVALARGTDVDKPRNLAKSVTVE